MKNSSFKILLLLFINCVLFIILFFVSNKPQYNIIDLNSNKEVLSRRINEDELWSFLSDLNDDKKIGQEGTSYIKEENILEEVPIAEDPIVVIKNNEEKKGVAKETDTKEALEKYETNETSFGIDVSSWQNNIDWKKVKDSGVNFAMIRAGFRKLDAGTIVMDNKFLNNIKGAIANNINVGVYFFSVATNHEEALEEAVWLCDVIKDYDITYPVAIDIETFDQNRMIGVSYDTMTENALIFCDYVRNKGYTPMIYSYSNALTKYFNTAKFSNERIWLAQYNDEVTYKGKYYMWQYTSSGSVPGINGRVDMNVAYFSITNDVTKASVVNGINNQGELEEISFIDLKMETILNKEVLLRTSPYNNLPNKAGKLESETNIIVTGISDDYVRIKYNGDTFYINDTECFVMNKDVIEFKDIEIYGEVIKEIELLKEPYNYLKDNVSKVISEGDIIILGESDYYFKIEYEEDIYYVRKGYFYKEIDKIDEELDNFEEDDGEEIERGENNIEEIL